VERKGRFALFGVDFARLEPFLIVISDMHLYLQLHFYADPPMRERLVYVAGFNQMEARVMRNLTGFKDVRTLGMEELRLRWHEFYVYEATNTNPLLPALVAGGAMVVDSGVIESRNINPRPGYLYRVRIP
jgi:hypothetical protein